jgi:hypothetical protein
MQRTEKQDIYTRIRPHSRCQAECPNCFAQGRYRVQRLAETILRLSRRTASQ